MTYAFSLPPRLPHAPVAPPTGQSNHLSAEDEELELVLAMSKAMADREEEERRRVAAEDEEMERVLKMSLQDK